MWVEKGEKQMILEIEVQFSCSGLNSGIFPWYWILIIRKVSFQQTTKKGINENWICHKPCCCILAIRIKKDNSKYKSLLSINL